MPEDEKQLAPALENYLAIIFRQEFAAGACRPSDIADAAGVARPSVTNALRELDAAGIPHEELFFDAEPTMTGEEIARSQGEDPDAVFKTLVTQGKSGGYYVFLVPVAAELDLKKAAAAAGEKAIAMIKARELLPLTGYVHGGCSPIGMKKRFPTFVDETAQLFDTIHFSGGKVGCQIRMNPDDLARLIPFQYADLTV